MQFSVAPDCQKSPTDEVLEAMPESVSAGTPPCLLVLPDVPYPLVSGGHLRDWQILNLLRRLGVATHVLYFGAGEGYNLDPDCPVYHVAQSVEFGGNRVERPDRSRLATVARKLQYVFQATPATHPFAFQYDLAGACERIVRHALKVGAKTVILRSFWCPYVEKLQRAGLRVIANCPDYNSALAWEMVRSVRKPLARVGPLCNWVGVTRLERRFLPLCDEVWVPTEAEARAMRRILPDSRLLILPNLVNVGGYPDLSCENVSEPVLLFVANFAYQPNHNAAHLLLTEVFPKIQQACSEASLLLVGRGLAPALRELACQPGVEAPGFVDDLTSVYRRAAVVLLPVREGAGMLVKALEALALGKPAVGFQESFRGIPDPGDTYVTVASPVEMAEQVTALLRDPKRRLALGRNARAMSQEELSWEAGLDLMRNSVATKAIPIPKEGAVS